MCVSRLRRFGKYVITMMIERCGEIALPKLHIPMLVISGRAHNLV